MAAVAVALTLLGGSTIAIAGLFAVWGSAGAARWWPGGPGLHGPRSPRPTPTEDNAFMLPLATGAPASVIAQSRVELSRNLRPLDHGPYDERTSLLREMRDGY